MNMRFPSWCATAVLLQIGVASSGLPQVQAAAPSLALETQVSVPIDVSADGELLLLFRPGLRGFELVNTRTGERHLVSETPCTGYFASISPDTQFVCFKEFTQTGGQRLQVPTLYDIAKKKLVPLCEPTSAAGNPVVSSRGQTAYTVGRQLIVLNRDFSTFLQLDLGALVNVLAFSPDGWRLAFGDPNEQISWIDLDTRKRSAVAAERVHGYQPRFSPKGQSLLALSANGEVTGCRLSDGLARSFGRAQSAAWLDEDTVALVCKEVADFAVRHTQVLKASLSDGAISTLLTKPGDAAVALNGSVIAFGAEDGISLADTQTGLLQKSAIQSLSATAPAQAKTTAVPATLTPQGVVTNSTTVQLTGVPYINQVYDTADSFSGYDSCCNATASLMAIQYYNRLPPHPITCTRNGSHTSNYGFYISSIYSYNGIVFNIPSSSVWGSSLAGWYGGFGYFLQDTTDDSLLHSTRLSQWIAGHGLTSGTDDNTSYAKAKAEIDANHPFALLNSLTSAGHYITGIGYVQNQYTLIFNDPYGNKNISYPGPQGAGAYYDWPGYNNGYQNLNTAWRYIYARGTVAANTNWGSYWDLNGPTAGAGAAPSGTWNSTSTNWSSNANGTVATGPWAEQNAVFSAGSDSTGSYTVSVSGTQVVANLFVQRGTVTFTGGQLFFLGTGSYFSNYVAAGAIATFNTPFGGGGSPDKWGPGTAVYNAASTSSGYFTLNEGTLALGNDAALSTVRLVVGEPSGVNVVTLKSADSTAHTLPNKLSFDAVNFNIGSGGNLTFTGPVDVGANSSTPTVIALSNSLTTLSGVLTNTGGLGKTGPGTLVLSGSSANTYGSTSANGNTTVSGGTLKLTKTAGIAAVPNGSLIVNTGGTLLLGAANQVGDAVPMTLSGGVFQTAGLSEQLGTLKLAANSLIDLGGGSSVLTFAASSAVAWTGGTVLTITNWTGSITGGGSDRILFGSNSSGLTSGQISQIRFANPPGFPTGSYAATILGTGEVVPLTAAPSITAQPQDRVAVVGDAVSFTCSLTGTPLPARQWRFNGIDLPGATAAILPLTNVTLSQAGTYSILLTNVAGSLISSNAALSVYSSAAPAFCSAACLPNGQFQLGLNGVPGYKYAILASTNLVDWTVLQTTNSPCTFTDTAATGCLQRFYRAQYVP